MAARPAFFPAALLVKQVTIRSELRWVELSLEGRSGVIAVEAEAPTLAMLLRDETTSSAYFDCITIPFRVVR